MNEDSLKIEIYELLKSKELINVVFENDRYINYWKNNKRRFFENERCMLFEKGRKGRAFRPPPPDFVRQKPFRENIICMIINDTYELL
jgi:hypothetical protein